MAKAMKRVPAARLRRCVNDLAAAVAAGAVRPEYGELRALRLMCHQARVDFPRELELAFLRMVANG